MGKQVPAGGCRGSAMGCSCQDEPPKQPPHTPRELLSIWISKQQLLCQGGGQGGFCLRFSDWDLAYPLLHLSCLGFGFPPPPSFARRNRKGRRRFVHLGDTLGTGLNFILSPDLLRLWSLPSPETSERYLNLRGGFIFFFFLSARQSKRKQIQLFHICKPSLCPGWWLLPPTAGPSAALW